MTTEVEKLRGSRKNPSVLKLKILKIRGEDPDVLIFIYEGPDDVPVYEEWMSRIEKCPRFESIPGAGKQQLLAYHQLLIENADPLLEKIFFFIDRDFDTAMHESPRVFELDAYSIENIVCTEIVVDSLLRDEFKRAGRIAERKQICAKFQEISQSFLDFSKDIHFQLFAAQRLGARVLKKPEKITDIVKIEVDALIKAYNDPTEVVEVEIPLPCPHFPVLYAEYEALSPLLKQRGKYILELFRRWIRALAEDLRSNAPKLFEGQDLRLPGDPSSISMRRLASATNVPPSLSLFVAQHVVGL